MTIRAISANFGTAQTGVGYTLKDATGADVGSRVTSGIVHIAAGVYYAAGVNDAGSIGVYWDCATTGINATEIFGDVAPTAIQIVDTLLDRDMSVGTDSGSPTVRTVRQALRFLRNNWYIAGTTLYVKKEDDVTDSWTGTVTRAPPGSDPISGLDPA